MDPRIPSEIFVPRFLKSMPSINRFKEFTIVLTPAPMVLPIKSHSILSTRLLKVCVNAFINGVILGPTFSQLIASYRNCNPLLIPQAISFPSLSQSWLRNAFRSLVAHSVTGVSTSLLARLSKTAPPPKPPDSPELKLFVLSES